MREVARPGVLRVRVVRKHAVSAAAAGRAVARLATTPTTPFTQCPAIGLDTSCGILVQLTDSGNNILADPTQGPYDGSDDTLIGIVNSSSSTVTTIALSSSTPIFGFDGDGLCVQSPAPSGCPFGSTGYEGPGTSFSGITPDTTGGFVTFSPGIAPGDTAYFSLEEPLSAATVTAGGPSLQEQGGPGNPSENPTTCSTQSPVNCATGVFWHTFADFAIPGRGVPLNLSRTYSSAQAGVDGPFGFGWTDSYDMSLAIDSSGDATITQEDGSAVTFLANGSGGFVPPPRVLATLTQNGDGSYTFIRNHGQVQYNFSAAGQLTSEVNLNGYQTVLAYDGSGHLATVTEPGGRTLSFTYTGSHVSTATDPMGRKWSYAYDGSGNLVTATDPAGRQWSYTYDSAHQLLTITDPRGGVITNVYNGSGQVTSQTDPAGRTTTWSYSGDPTSSSGGQTTMTDPMGNVTTYDYSDLELTSMTQAAGTALAATTSYAYDPVTLGVTSVTDPNGNVTSNTYDSAGNLLSTTDPLGNTTSFGYDSFNQILYRTTPLGETTNYSYDSSGNLLSVADPLGNTTTYTYGDSAHPGDVTSVTDPDGNTVTYTYDSLGDLASMSVSPSSGVNDTTTYAYDLDGERTCVAPPAATNASVSCPPAGNPAVAGTTATTYNADGGVTSVTDPDGNVTTYSYDGDGNKVQATDAAGHVTSFSYNADNQLTKTSRPDGTTMTSAYDANGNVVKQVNGAGDSTGYTYDALSRVSTSTNALGLTTSYGYDLAGNQTSLTDPRGQTTSYSYDSAGQLVGISYSDGSTPPVAIGYDADGQRTTMTDGTGTTSYSFDADGHLTSVTNGAGATVSYGYDAAGLLTSLGYPNGQTVTRTFDGARRLASVQDWLGNTTKFSYDPNGDLTGITYPNGVMAKSTFDAAGYLTGITDKTSSTTLAAYSYSRNALGEVTSATSTGAVPGTQSYSYSQLSQLASDSAGPYSYDQAGDPTSLSGGVTQTFNAAGELLSSTGPASPRPPVTDAVVSANESAKGSKITSPAVTTKSPGELLLAFISAGGPSTKTQNVGSVTGGGLTWSLVARSDTRQGTAEIWQAQAASPLSGAVVTATLHDTGYDGSITVASFTGATASAGAHATASGASGAPKVPLTTTGADSLAWAVGEIPGHAVTVKPLIGQTIVHRYSDTVRPGTFWAQRSGVIAAKSTKVTLGATSPTAYKWDLAAVEITAAPPSGTVTTSYGYDKNGNRTSIAVSGGPTTTLSYDQANRLTGYGTAASYSYNGDGLRMSKTVGSKTTSFSWNQSGATPQVLAAGSTSYLDGPNGQPIEQVTGSTPVYLLADQQGSTRLLTNGASAVTGTYTYNSYGLVAAHTGTSATALLFDGQYTDAETGYQYLQARYYDPGTAQFLNVDPAAAVTSQPYSFASANPVNLADPTGLAAAAACVTVTGSGHFGVGGSLSYEVCDWVGNGWAAETVSLSGGIGAGLGGGASASYSDAFDPNANNPADLEGPSVTGSASAKFGGGVEGSVSYGSGGFSGEVGGSLGTPDASVEGGGGYTWVVGSTTNYTSSFVPPGLKSLYDRYSGSLKSHQSPNCDTWSSGQGDFPDNVYSNIG